MKYISTKGKATSNSLLPTPQPTPPQASANPPQEDAGVVEYDDNHEGTEAPRRRRAWGSIVKNGFKSVVAFLGAAAAAFRIFADLNDLVDLVDNS